ncbi:MAG: glycosyltransferase family 29 protein [Marinosulfonomonas sp.]|nr:glycosyltransferase family 29 protein [Marinosulfonomonas sp.]
MPALIERIGFQFEKRLSGDRIQARSAQASELMRELAGKTVSIVGNARALTNENNGPDIDLADIVVRINRAPRPTEASHGRATDWLALATSMPKAQVRKLRPSRVLWMSPKTKRIPFWATGLPGFFVNPKTEWQRLNEQLQSSPTTGLMIIELIRNSDAKSVKLYGFDFFASKSLTGRREASQVPHDFSAEQAFVDDILANDPRFHLIPTTT